MGYINDEDLFKAISFASSMIKKGTSKGLAIHKASKYYNVPTHDVASKLGKRGATVANFKRTNTYKEYE